MTKKTKKIVLTGAPSSGKTSVLQELQKKELPHVVLVPESAVVLLSGGFPAPAHGDLGQIRVFQESILSLQKNIEVIFEAKYPDATHFVLDRASLDGAAFWPPGPDDFWKTFSLDYQRELLNYAAVVFLEMPPEEFFGGVHKARFHNYQQSYESGLVLEKIWSQHPRFIKVPAQRDFQKKLDLVWTALKQELNC